MYIYIFVQGSRRVQLLEETWDLALDFKNTSAEGVDGEGGGASLRAA